MINRRELAICKRRGHAGIAYQDWTQCKWCGTWLREVRKLEEREDEPPEHEVDVRVRVSRHLEHVKSDIESSSGKNPGSGLRGSKKEPRGAPKNSR